MILRLVKMEFRPEETSNFLAYFETIKDKIQAMPGIMRLNLYQHGRDENIIFTHSLWVNESYLNNYRHSELFSEVWPKTKQLFASKAAAWSLNLK